MRRNAFRLLTVCGLTAMAGCGFGKSTPLSRAAGSGDVHEIVRLLDAGTPIDEIQGRGLSALVLAARSGQIEAVRLLLSRGADPERRCGVNDWTPLEHALHKGQNAAALLLLDAGRSRGPALDRALVMAAGYGNPAMVRALLGHGARAGASAPGGVTALSSAVGGAWDIDYAFPGCEPHAEAVRALLEADPSLRLGSGTVDEAARRFARKHGCDSVLALVDGIQSAAGR